MSRFIDADELEKKIREYFKDLPKRTDAIAVMSIINEQPKADVIDKKECLKCVFYPFKQLREQEKKDMVEVAHGEWITHKNSQISCNHLITNYECSVCHTWCRYHSNYCPDCGAKMGETKND